MAGVQMADGYDAGAPGSRLHRPTVFAERRRRERGFSLIEVLVMGSIVAVALLGAVSLFPASQSQIYRAASTAQGTAIARGRLELIKNKGAGVFTATDCPASDTNQFPGFTLSCSQRSATPDGLPAPSVIVTLTVSWGGPQEGSVTMAAPVMRPDQ